MKNHTYYIFIIFLSLPHIAVGQDDDNFKNGIIVLEYNQWPTDTSKFQRAQIPGVGASINIIIKLHFR